MAARPGSGHARDGSVLRRRLHLVVDDRADVHVNSKDGRFYLGWFPSGRPGTDGEGWKIAVTGTAKVRGYQMSFDTETPADVVAAAVARVLETSQRV